MFNAMNYLISRFLSLDDALKFFFIALKTFKRQFLIWESIKKIFYFFYKILIVSLNFVS